MARSKYSLGCGICYLPLIKQVDIKTKVVKRQNNLLFDVLLHLFYIKKMTLGKNIKKLRELKKITQQELSDLTGGLVSQGAIAALEKRESRSSSFTGIIAKALGVSVQQLTDGGIPLEDIKEQSALSYRHVPLISMVQAGAWSEIKQLGTSFDALDWLPCPVAHSEDTFCVRVEGESMKNTGSKPSYDPGDIIFVDPNRAAKPGDRVVVRLEDQNMATFKQYIEEDGIKRLKALNPEWSPRYIEINGNANVVGVVIGKWVPE